MAKHWFLAALVLTFLVLGLAAMLVTGLLAQ